MYKRRLPPLDPLVAFEAAARLLSFTRASEELHLTQAAISQQIRSLEESLQAKLFTRSHRAVQLTREGREFQHTVSVILRQLAGATTDIRLTEVSQKLTISCDLSIAQLWLAPKLAALKRQFLDLSFHLITSDEDKDCLADEVQLVMIHGAGEWPGFISYRLFDEIVFPVCAPGYPQATDENWENWLVNAELLDLEDSHWNWLNWRVWLGSYQIDQPLPHRNLRINNYPLIIEAACQGHGVALGWSVLVDDLIDQGRLIKPTPVSLTTDLGYYLLVRESRQNEAQVAEVRDWLLTQFKVPV
ncbi:MAG: LysR family glycine cleavage system transcriptional activator [Gammaproteobacteria bacterium]|jgi:LysR family glycine cleavage system transcriptional activator